jgi:very-short-patch-repair endonuclease
VFLELDGEQHKDQPRYDATRQTAVIATTRWLVGRYTWTDIVRNPTPTLRSIAKLLNM